MDFLRLRVITERSLQLFEALEIIARQDAQLVDEKATQFENVQRIAKDAIKAVEDETAARSKPLSNPITAEEFLALSPRARGYVVYMYGMRDDQPNVPEEENPYPSRTREWEEWGAGAHMAMLLAQEGDD